MSSLHPTVSRVTDRIIERSKDTRRSYLELIDREGERHADRNAVLPDWTGDHNLIAQLQ